MFATQQTIEALSRRIEQAIRGSLPSSSGLNERAQIELWMERETRFKSMYASVARFCRCLFGIHGMPVQGVDIVFNPPDVLRAELLANGDAAALQRAVETATTRESSKLANLITGPVFNSFQQAGIVGKLEPFGSSVRRITLGRSDGAIFECDMAATTTAADPKTLWAVSRRVVRSFPSWLSPELVVHTGRCVRLSDSQQHLLPPPTGNVSVLAIGPFVFATSPAIVPAAPKPAVYRPQLQLPRLKTIGTIGAAAGVLVPLVLGLATGSTLLTVIGGLGIIAAVVALLVGRSNYVRTP